MKNFSRKQIIAMNRLHLTPLRQEKQLTTEEEIELQFDQDELNHLKFQSYNQMMQQGKGKSNLKKSTTVNESIKELTTIVKLLSNKINIISQQSNRIQQRFQSVNIEPSHKLIKQLKNNQCESLKQRKRMIENWLGTVCREVFSVGFLLYKKDQLKLKEVKSFCSENVLRNIINLSREYQITKDDIENINNCLTKDLLVYFKRKYPQTLQSEVNLALSKSIIPIDNMQSNNYDLVFKSGINFQKTKDSNYNLSIMKLINYVALIPHKEIKKIQQQTNEEQGQEKTKFLFDCFYQKMNELMEFICKRPQDREQPQNKSQDKPHDQTDHNKQYKKEQKQKQKQYSEKVKSYTGFQIGQKLSKNFQLYQQNQICQQSIRFRSSAQIRVLTKWCEELEKYFDEDYIMERQIPFRMKNGSQAFLNHLRLRILCALLAQEKQFIKKRLNEINENNYLLQSKFSSMNIHENLEMFLQEESIIGQFSTGIYKSYENYLTNYLNVLIDRINVASNNFLKMIIYYNYQSLSEKKYFQQVLDKSKDKAKFKQEILTVNNFLTKADQKRVSQSQIFYQAQIPQLISFNIGDLIRCRYTSKQTEILDLYHRLQIDPDIKIVRVKNRLDSGNRDILINALFKNQVITEIQLCIKSEKSRFIQCSNQFNHFFYELKRAQFGPISEMVNIWINYDSRSQHFMQKIDDLFGPKTKKQNDYQIQKQIKTKCCDNQLQNKVSLPFQCSQCKSHYFDVYQSDGNTVCLNCSKFLCMNCQLKMQEIIKTLSIKNNQKVINITVLKDKSIFVDKPQSQQNLVLLNLKSKQRKAKPFRIIQQQGKIHFFEKQQNNQELNLIKTFKKNQNYPCEIKKFLNKNLVIQAHGLNELVPQFGLKYTMDHYFFPKFFEQAYKKQKDSIIIRGKSLENECLPINQNKNTQKIRIIDFSQNNLTNIETIIKTFPNLQSTNLSNNQIEILPKEIFELQKLKILELSFNQIKILPENQNSKKIQELYLHNNEIQQISNFFFNFNHLKILRLFSNKINKLPQNQPDMNNLEALSLQKNQITQIPNEFFNFDKLKILRLDFNKINKLPQNKPNMNCLEQLYLDNNQIEEIPNNFFNFNNLKTLRLYENKIKKLPQSKPNMPNLQTLSIHHNQIEIIPNEFFNFEKLKILKLFSNKIHQLPSNKPNMNHLQELYLDSNQLTEIPNEFFNFDRLKFLRLDSNKIINLPQNKPNMNSLERLSLQKNQIQDLPNQFFNFDKLKYLRLDQNKIKKLPQNKPNMPYLQQLHLSKNQITIISSSFFNFPQISLIEFKNNPITQIQQTLISPKLTQLRMDENLKLDQISQNNLISIKKQIIKNKTK